MSLTALGQVPGKQYGGRKKQQPTPGRTTSVLFPHTSVGWSDDLAPVSCCLAVRGAEQESTLIFAGDVGDSIQCQLQTT